METTSETARDISLLDQIERDPDVTQASLASQLGVAVGTVNWHLKRLIAKGYIKVKRAQRRKLRYIITPEGIAFRARLTVNYIESSMRLYRRTRQRMLELLGEVKQNGYDRVAILGEGDIADICRLTCLEQGVRVIEDPAANSDGLPVLEVRDLRVHLIMDKKAANLPGSNPAPQTNRIKDT